MIRIPSRIYGVKWEPIAAMIALLFVGLWLVYQPLHTRPGAYVVELRVANERGNLESYTDPDTHETSYRLLLRNKHETPLTAEQIRSIFGERVYRTITTRPSNALFRLFNITSWASMAWILIGYTGQIIFGGRAFVQWFASEKERKSSVPEIYWWMSLVGGVMLFAYFSWRQDFVGVLGQCSGVVIYARNIRLIHKHRRRAAQPSVNETGDRQ
jgi:lipid-A-disaccharide synthase-like uncharacterized protein